MFTSTFRSWCARLCGLVALVSISVPAHGADLGADVGAAVPAQSGGNAGLHVRGRIGLDFGLGPVTLQPEIGGSYVSLGAGGGAANGGVRILFLDTFRPGVYGHVGVAYLGSVGAMGDVGVVLDVRPVPVFSVGAHAGYANLCGVGWADLGGHAELHF